MIPAMTTRTAIIRMAEGGRFEFFQTAALWAQQPAHLRQSVRTPDAVDELFSHAEPQTSRPPTMREAVAAFCRGQLIPHRVLSPERTLGWVAPGDIIGHGFINGRALMRLGVEQWAKHELGGVSQFLVWDYRRYAWCDFQVEADGYEGLTACLRRLTW